MKNKKAQTKNVYIIKPVEFQHIVVHLKATIKQFILFHLFSYYLLLFFYFVSFLIDMLLFLTDGQ